ncbi:hypothetical protein LPJ59_002934 [Coemansia sp. RSA 2399]|nr:hypothetical protein LPJ59_002934 [Coemansia sp. RSA 2399]KAJ1904253.1 hypothetical protein LPJ81_002603 [Coemansia sp. IMI 209127]
MHVAILGATRNTGKSFVEQAIAKGGIDITALVRTPESLTYTEEQLAKITVVKGNALLKEDVAKAIADADVILFTLGAKFNGFNTPPDAGIESKAAQVVLDVIKEKRADNPPRFIMVSSTGAGGSYDVPYLMRPLYMLILRTPHRYKAAAESSIKSSGVPYTIVRPAFFVNGEITGKYRAGPDVCGYTISRNDLAHFILERCVVGGEFVNESPSLAF